MTLQKTPINAVYLQPNTIGGAELFWSQGNYKFHQYQVVGRHLPTEKDENPTIYRMKLWAEDSLRAKSKFWWVQIHILALWPNLCLDGTRGLVFKEAKAVFPLSGACINTVLTSANSCPGISSESCARWRRQMDRFYPSTRQAFGKMIPTAILVKYIPGIAPKIKINCGHSSSWRPW